MTATSKRRRDPAGPPPPLRAFSVTESEENTGGILFDRYAVAARRHGADRFSDGDFHSVSCRRASWADHCAETGRVPASLMVAHGWHFECTGCGRRIDEDMPYLWESGMQDGESPKGAQLLYARWKPAHVVGDQYGSVFCRKSCRKSHVAEQKRIKTCSQRIERILIRMIGTRFPDAAIVTEGMNKPRIYLRRDRTGHVRIDEAGVHFDFPGQKYGPASLVIRTITEWTGQKSKRHRGKPSYECLRGDVDVFEAYAASTAREERAA